MAMDRNTDIPGQLAPWLQYRTGRHPRRVRRQALAHVTVIDVRKLDDLFDGKIKERDIVVAEPELGLAPCTPPLTDAATPTRLSLSTVSS